MTGMSAYRGNVKGVVRIIKDKREFHKMRKGDILIAPNTRPEFVPIMKMAGAIVTEEGGITCHAAIVSRELKIPCIVGVQGITSNLKDGDNIEVDAVNGVIKKL
jgi:pyruvate,water dikinase